MSNIITSMIVSFGAEVADSEIASIELDIEANLDKTSFVPGDIVKVVFNEAFASGDFFLYQHSGFWLVKRVVHVLTSSFMSNILLTRNGIDSSIENTLVEAVHQKR